MTLGLQDQSCNQPSKYNVDVYSDFMDTEAIPQIHAQSMSGLSSLPTRMRETESAKMQQFDHRKRVSFANRK